MQIIYDQQLDTKQLMPIAVQALEGFFRAAANGNTTSPIRHAINVDGGSLVFTIGAETEFSQSIGFRVYDTFPNNTGTNTDQIIAVYSTKTSKLKGLFIGAKLGAIRTAAINAVAVKYMSNPKSAIATLIGAGHQAHYQIEALLAVRKIKKIHIHNRTPAHAQKLIDQLQPIYNVEFIISANLENALNQSDIVICATSSTRPVLKTKWLKPNVFVSSIGAKYGKDHELPLNIAPHCGLITTDSLAQLAQYKPPYEIKNLSSLVDIVTQPQNLQNGINLFLSCGLSGTEVAIGDAVLKTIPPT